MKITRRQLRRLIREAILLEQVEGEKVEVPASHLILTSGFDMFGTKMAFVKVVAVVGAELLDSQQFDGADAKSKAEKHIAALKAKPEYKTAKVKDDPEQPLARL
jgi:hypothetical protein